MERIIAILLIATGGVGYFWLFGWQDLCIGLTRILLCRTATVERFHRVQASMHALYQWDPHSDVRVYRHWLGLMRGEIAKGETLRALLDLHVLARAFGQEEDCLAHLCIRRIVLLGPEAIEGETDSKLLARLSKNIPKTSATTDFHEQILHKLDLQPK